MSVYGAPTPNGSRLLICKHARRPVRRKRWGWNDNGYGYLADPVYFATTGAQTIRVLRREDGIAIDQIVLSAGTYLTTAPGAAKNDTTVIPR